MWAGEEQAGEKTMRKRRENKTMADYENLRDEMIRDKVREVVAENPGNALEALEEIGFIWFDDDYPSEEEEENGARPENDPTNLDLLTGLIFYHEFERNLPELITHLTRACQFEDDLPRFSEIAWEFYYGTQADGYHALAALQEIFAEDSDKRTIIDYLISVVKGDQEEVAI